MKKRATRFYAVDPAQPGTLGAYTVVQPAPELDEFCWEYHEGGAAVAKGALFETVAEALLDAAHDWESNGEGAEPGDSLSRRLRAAATLRGKGEL